MNIAHKLTILTLSATALKIDKLYLDGGAITNTDGIDPMVTFNYNQFAQ